MTEAAAVDGARPYQAFRAVVFPLLLIAVAPLLISSFAYNFNNFNVDPADDRRRAVPAGQPEGRWHGHPRQLRLPAGVRRGRGAVRLRRRRVGAHLHDRGHRLDHRLPPDRRPRGDQPMTGQSWFGAVGWRHIVAILAIIFALIPIVFVASAAFNPLGTLSSTSLIPKEFGTNNFENLFNKTGVRELVRQLDPHRRVSRRSSRSRWRRSRRTRSRATGSRDGARACCSC